MVRNGWRPRPEASGRLGRIQRKRLAVPTIQTMLARPSSPPATRPATARSDPPRSGLRRPPPGRRPNTSEAITRTGAGHSLRRISFITIPHDAIATRQNPEQQPHQQETRAMCGSPVGEVAETQPNQTPRLPVGGRCLTPGPRPPACWDPCVSPVGAITASRNSASTNRSLSAADWRRHRRRPERAQPRLVRRKRGSR